MVEISRDGKRVYWTPRTFSWSPVGYERGAIVKIAAWRSNRINRAAINLAQPISSTAIRNHPLSCGDRGLRGRGLLLQRFGKVLSEHRRVRWRGGSEANFMKIQYAIASGRLANTEAFRQSRRERKKIEMRFAHMKRILKFDRLRLRG